MVSRQRMVARQKVLADFGEFALRSDSLDDLLNEGCRLVRDALGTDFAKVLEIEPDGKRLLVKAGVGWSPGIVGETRLSMGDRSSETYAIEAARPVISKDIDNEERFEFADFMKAHGVVALVNVPIFLPGGKPYGLLQVDSREPRDFGEEDIEFLRTYATLLGPVIDRLHKAHSLKQALEANQRLLQELQHRVKNQMAVITSLVGMRARQVSSSEAREELTALAERINTLRLVHEQLYTAGTPERLRLRPFVVQLVENLCHVHDAHSGKVRLDFPIEADVDLTPEVAVPVGLILNEFVTNSLKYAFEGQGGVIAVTIEPTESGGFRLRICDNGRGLPTARQAMKPGSGTGIRLIDGLARQIGAKPVWSSRPGTALCLELDRR
jgi:two-component sensor histidine kinase